MNLLRHVVEGLEDPAINGRWIATIAGATPSGNDPSGSIIVEAINPGFVKTPPRQRIYGGFSYNFPETANIDAVNITFYESHKYHVTKWLNDWHKQVFDHDTEIYGLPAVYRKDITVQLFPVDSQIPLRVIKLKGCWPSDRAPFDLNYTTPDGRIMVQSQFSVTSIEIKNKV